MIPVGYSVIYFYMSRENTIKYVSRITFVCGCYNENCNIITRFNTLTTVLETYNNSDILVEYDVWCMRYGNDETVYQ